MATELVLLNFDVIVNFLDLRVIWDRKLALLNKATAKLWADSVVPHIRANRIFFINNKEIPTEGIVGKNLSSCYSAYDYLDVLSFGIRSGVRLTYGRQLIHPTHLLCGDLIFCPCLAEELDSCKHQNNFYFDSTTLCVSGDDTDTVI